MSEIAIDKSAGGEGAFNARTMLLITAIGTLAFIAMLVLGAYAPDLRSGKNGGAHALSNAAVGFTGLVRLADATGHKPVIVRVSADLDSENLAVITPDHGWTDLSDILQRRGSRATLIVLPKWRSAADAQRPGWVRIAGVLPAGDPARILYPSTTLGITREKTQSEPLRNVDPAAAPPDLRFFAPRIVQTMNGRDIVPLITTANGHIVLGKVAKQPLYLLSDPDLINNHGLSDVRQAKAAVALLDYLNSTGSDSVLFDVTANGLGQSRSPLKLAFDPPFLAVTLTIFVAMLLAGWQALVRFGPVRRAERAIAFGKAALVDNSAALIRKAGREAHLGGRYVEVVRERAMALFRIPATLDAEALSARLEGLNPDKSFASATNAATQAHTRGELLSAAKSIHQWLREVQQ
jgi:hypothetical protein